VVREERECDSLPISSFSNIEEILEILPPAEIIRVLEGLVSRLCDFSIPI